LTSDSFFNFSQLYSILHRQSGVRLENYSLPILKYHQFISKYFQKIGTIIIPSIKINKVMYSEKKEKKIPYINGGYMISEQQYKGWLNNQDLAGLIWFSKDYKKTTLSLNKEKVSVTIEKPKTKIVVLSGSKPSYNIIVKANALLIQNEEERSISNIEEDINKKIKKEILTTVKKGIDIETDPLNISEKTYRYYQRKWDLNTIKAFDKRSIKNIRVLIHIEQSENYKR
ncbi:Ger(x)C family spore germination C-terminal domain-containing protein, partial [Neobacillus drentensis]|uniref:Ger(x)C family spore germination C-terminal domain-containing protein n=1 Tax=Neobacillus drentensis TaxID=220684 RepID=UPI002FFE5B44